MLSRKSKCGLKALLVLAQEAGRGPVLVAGWRNGTRRRRSSSKRFFSISSAGIVHSKKGKGGGYFARSPMRSRSAK
jgi:DNA-binding IscR family transcriptional regulator